VRELMRETRAALSAVLDTCSLQSLTERARREAWMQSITGDAA
jgi:DNA-binding IscR family transcriptional regulator